jgi:NAD(P)-dependent dehydrogenase (short-subunit alcohol dehydrogenase family)|tara:strand:- start:13426 stop:14226 length:801 start_codon:yes stop_codon:yes gene_type:complete
MAKVLVNKVAVVTGAGHPRGIGRAIAVKLAEAGAHVVATDLLGAEGLDSVVAALENCGVEAMALGADVTSAKQVNRAMEEVIERFGHIDILVNNAGVGVGSAEFMELTDQDWDLSMSVNLRGVVNCCQAVLPQMKKQSGGSLITIASQAGLGAVKSIPACYTASKFAVVGLSKHLALNYAKDNIRSNAICPGSIVTQMHGHTLELLAQQHGISVEHAQRLEDDGIPLGYSAQPTVIGDAVVYLASPAASYITGISLPVAGGMSLGI